MNNKKKIEISGEISRFFRVKKIRKEKTHVRGVSSQRRMSIPMEAFQKAPPGGVLDVPSFVHNVNENQVSDDLGIVNGVRGTLTEVLGNRFVTRTPGQKFGRGLLYVGSAMMIFPGLGFLSKSVMVPDGSIGIAVNDGVPEIYRPGRHCLISPLNKKKHFRTFELTNPYINVQNLHILQIGDEEYALASDQGKPLILGPGVHFIDNAFFKLLMRVPQSQKIISNGTLHRVIIEEGRRGIAMDGQIPIFLKPGVYTRLSPLFQFLKSVPVDEQVVELGPYIIVTPFDGEVGIAFKLSRPSFRTVIVSSNLFLISGRAASNASAQGRIGSLQKETKSFWVSCP